LTYRLKQGIGRRLVLHSNQGRSDMQKQHMFLSKKLNAPVIPKQAGTAARAG
jgi:hypothetical protein